MSIRNLDAMFQPRSVAVVGASAREGSLGAVVWRNLRQSGFKGQLWPVNRRAQAIDGEPVYTDVEALPQAPELAVICTPATTVPQLVAELAHRGTRAAIVITAGLRTSTDEAGRSLEQRMLEHARPSLLRILGPNCIGTLVPEAGLNASFAAGQARPGPLAFVAQSGALATAMLDWADAQGIGFSHFVSLGDSADVDFGDMLDYLASDSGTRAILMYMESVKHARKFMSAARAAARNKPVILVKGGRRDGGAKAAASHTGALAGSDAVFDAAVRRAGMLRVDTLEALFDGAQTLARVRRWQGPRLAILTNGGGAGVLAADTLGEGDLAVLSDQTRAALDACLPANWSGGNPVDIVGDAPPQRYVDALRILLDAPEVDGVLFMHAPTAMATSASIAQACLPLCKDAGKAVLSCWLGGHAVDQARQLFAEAGVACYPTPERAATAWLQLRDYHAAQRQLLQLAPARSELSYPDRDGARHRVESAVAGGQEWLDEADAKAVLQAYGIPTVPTERVRAIDEAVEAAYSIGYPVALKIVSRQILHKSDVGGVVLNLANGDELRTAAILMRQRIARECPHAHVIGYTVQPMVKRPGAREVIAGVADDPVFGPTLLFGEGGTAVEVRADRAIGLPPLNDVLARDMVSSTQIGKLLAGFRGQKVGHVDGAVDVLLRLSQLVCDLPAIRELDINPLLVDEQGVIALDARVRLGRDAGQGKGRLALAPYPSGLERSVQADGQTFQVRPIRPEDGQRLSAFYSACSPADMRLRFFLTRREVPHSELARYCQIDYDREMTFVALAGEELAGEVRAVCDPDNEVAEFAIQVGGPWQGKGLGRALLDLMIDYLRKRGTRELSGSCLAENRGMAALAKHAGFETESAADGAVKLRLRLR